MERSRILIYDSRLVAEGLRLVLQSMFEVVGTVHNSTDALRATLDGRPDILLVEPSLKGSLETVLKIRAQTPDVKIMFITLLPDRPTLGIALRSGVLGFVLKTESGAALCAAAATVSRGKRHITAELSDDVPWGLALRRVAGEQIEDGLTGRQLEVLQLVVTGKTIRQIGETLGIAPKTAEFHKAGLMHHLGTRTTAELIRFAVEHEMVPAA